MDRELRFSRTRLLIGEDGLEKLSKKRVAVFGVGGVGGFVCEALARAGVGHIDVIDKDIVDESNINRQLIALSSTIGRNKVDVISERLKDINEEIKVTKHLCFFLPETARNFEFSKYDYVVDAIDTVTGKIELVMKCKAEGVPIISAMGAGNKLEPTAFEVSDIYNTKICPLAKVMRKELKKRGVESLKVVYSKEAVVLHKEGELRKRVPGSISFVPPVVGIIIAGEVIKSIIE